MEYIIGVDIGGTNFRIGMVSPEGEVCNVHIQPSDFLAKNGDAVVELSEYLKAYIAKWGKEKIKAVSVGFPGSVSKDLKSTYSVPNIISKEGKHVFDNINVADKVKEITGVEVLINKDVNNLLEYDMITNDLKSEDAIVGCYIGTGFGGSIYLDGKFLLGKNGVASEIGHIPFYKSNLICACGKKACVECYASGRALRLLQEDKYPQTHIGDMFTKHKDEQPLIDFVEACAIPIATEINIFDPECVIIGGGVVNMQDFPREMLLDFVHENTRKPYPAKNIKLVFSKYCKDMGVIGAAVFAMDILKITPAENFSEKIREYVDNNN